MNVLSRKMITKENVINCDSGALIIVSAERAAWPVACTGPTALYRSPPP